MFHFSVRAVKDGEEKEVKLTL